MTFSDSIAVEKQKLIRKIKKIITPKLRDSGYLEGRLGSKPFQLCIFLDDLELPKTIEIEGFVLKEITGFAEAGIVLDAISGGLYWEPWECFPLEDLILVSLLLESRADQLN